MKGFLRIVGFLEWALGAVSLTVIGTVLSLKELSSKSQVTVLVVLYVFLVVTVIRQFEVNGWFRRSRWS
jgi:hypothetical protein